MLPSKNSRAQAQSFWRKSSFCPSGAACVEIDLRPDGGAGFRDAKDPDPALSFEAPRWREFIAGAKAGEFDRG